MATFSTMFNKGPGADEETQWDEDDQKLALELWNEGKEVKDPKKKKVGGKLKKAMLASGAATALNMRHLLWSVQDLYENKIKRDGRRARAPAKQARCLHLRFLLQ